MRRIAFAAVMVCAAGPARAERYVVQPGETLEHVAQRFHCSTDAVLRANRRDNVLVPPHTVVEIPACAASITARARTRSPHADAGAGADPDALARAALAAIDGRAPDDRSVVRIPDGRAPDDRSVGRIPDGRAPDDRSVGRIPDGHAPDDRSVGRMPDAARLPVDVPPPDALADPTASQSIGEPWHGALRHGRLLPASEAYTIRRPARAYGADRAVAALRAAIGTVRAGRPDAPVLAIGDLSAEHGGPIGDHLSHQSGLDADVGFYFTHAPKTYPAEFVAAEDGEFDLPLNYALLTALLPHAQMIFLDTTVQARLYKYAASLGTPKAELERIFQYPRGASAQAGIVRHWPHHGDHFHVRFRER